MYIRTVWEQWEQQGGELPFLNTCSPLPKKLLYLRASFQLKACSEILEFSPVVLRVAQLLHCSGREDLAEQPCVRSAQAKIKRWQQKHQKLMFSVRLPTKNMALHLWNYVVRFIRTLTNWKGTLGYLKYAKVTNYIMKRNIANLWEFIKHDRTSMNGKSADCGAGKQETLCIWSWKAGEVGNPRSEHMELRFSWRNTE